MFIKSLIKETNFIFHCPHTTFWKNILSTIFYGFIFSKFLPIAKCTLKLEHFLPRVSELYSRMLSQYQSSINKPILKGFQRYLDVLKKYGKNFNDLFQELENYLYSNQSWSNWYFLFIRFEIKSYFQ